ENASILEIQECRQINCSDLGLPNLTHECTTCGSKAILSVEDMAQILNKICPTCKSIRKELQNNISYVLLLPNITI
ncbi:hypothetical protein HN51_016155, partial [Arachis hypogaea]